LSLENKKNSNLQDVVSRLQIFIDLILIWFITTALALIASFIISKSIDPNYLLFSYVNFYFNAIIFLFVPPFSTFLLEKIQEDYEKTDFVPYSHGKIQKHHETRESIDITEAKLLYGKQENNNWRSIFKNIYYGILLFFLIFLPLDVTTYLIPGMLDANTEAIITNRMDSVINQPWTMFNILIFIWVIMVALKEEGFYRRWMQDYIDKRFGLAKGLPISSIVFGLNHFNYWFLTRRGLHAYIIWALSAILFGFVMGIMLMKTGNIVASFTCHTLSNLISFNAIYFHNQGYDIFWIIQHFYIWFLIISVILAIFNINKIKNSFKYLKKLLLFYFIKVESNGTETKNKLNMDTIKNILLAIIIWAFVAMAAISNYLIT